MKIITKAKNLELSAALQNFIDEKIGGLKKFIDILKREDEDSLPAGRQGKTLAEVFVEVEKETKYHNKGEIFNCQIEILLPGKSLSAESSSDDMYKAIMAAKNEMEEEIKRYKLKNIKKNRRQQRKTKKELEI